MKSHISATIDAGLIEALHEIRKRERRSLSNILETAVVEFIQKKQATNQIVSSPGVFAGRFSRKETYARPAKR